MSMIFLIIHLRNGMKMLKKQSNLLYPGFNTIASFGLSMGGIMATKAATEQLVDYAGTFAHRFL